MIKCTVSPENIKKVKALGCLRDKRTADCFNVRVITRNGKITAKEAEHIAAAAKKFGNGELAFTVRLTVEIQCVPYDNIEPLRQFLKEGGLETGGTGAKVRPIVCCKGTSCVFGLIDTFGLASDIHERFYEGYHNVALPHKFKIGVGGCPNNCAKPDLNDIGIIGQRIVEIDYDKCRGCKKCLVAESCPISAAQLVDGKIHICDECNSCGRCFERCPFGAFSKKRDGYKILIGGRWGKKCARGVALSKIFFDKEEVLAVVEKAILLFKEQGAPGERFNDTVTRLGLESVEKILLSDDILNRKDEILGDA